MKSFDKLFFVSLFLAIFGWSATACAQADFYKGKTITVYIGTTPGALYDQWVRILAMHMSKHIPGKPEISVQNMPRGGHMMAAGSVHARTQPERRSRVR